MNVDREIVLPGNFTYMRTCTPILHLDDSISLACRRAGRINCPKHSETQIFQHWYIMYDTIKAQFSTGIQMMT